MTRRRCGWAWWVAIGLAACRTEAAPPASPPAAVPPAAAPVAGDAEATSLRGAPLVPPELSADVRADRERELAGARAAFEANPGDVMATVWLGRRLAYLGRYRDAIDTYTAGLAAHPESPELLRHRGHRYITVRKFAQAIEDLDRAAALVTGQPDVVELDGLPNAAGVPTGTLHTNIHYHRALAHYLVGDFEAAREAYVACMAASTTDDMKVATSHWLCMTLRRLGRDDEAAALLDPITADLELYENFSYHRLLLLYKGEVDPSALIPADPGETNDIDRATLGYGLGTWHLVQGDRDAAVAAWTAASSTPQWAAFGAIAAEADLARLEQPR